MEDQELLKYAIERDMISMSYIKDKYEMDKRKKYLEKHPYAVWEGKNGFWYTHFPLKGGGRCSNPRCLTPKKTGKRLKIKVSWYFEILEKSKGNQKGNQTREKTEGGNSFMYDIF